MSTGIYFKFIKSFSDDKLKVESTSIDYKTVSRQLNLGEMISLLDEMDSIEKEYQIESIENNSALKRLKTTNFILITLIVLSFLLFIWSIKKIQK